MNKKPFEMLDLSAGECGCEHDEECGGNHCRCRRERDRSRLPAVLIVDDDPEFLGTLKSVLLDTGKCRVFTADSVPTAAKMLRDTPVALVIADHYLPGRTGTGLLEHVRSHYPGVGRFLMSGRATRTVLAGAINRARAHQYLPKSMAPHLLVKRVLGELPNSHAN